MVYVSNLDRFYYFSMSDRSQTRIYTDDEGQVKHEFYIQHQYDNWGITVYSINVCLYYENGEWISVFNTGNTMYDTRDFNFHNNDNSYQGWTDVNNFYIVSCSSRYTASHNDGSGTFEFPSYSSLLLPTFDVTFSTTDITYDPITAYTNYFDFEDYSRYTCYISSDTVNWNLMHYETLFDTTTNTTKFRLNYTILGNGTYYFKFVDNNDNSEHYVSRTVTNILQNSINSGFTDSGIPQPFVSYERIGEYFVLKTQSFTKEDINKYKCLYTTDNTLNYSDWENMSHASLYNSQLKQTEYYFSLRVPRNSEDCTYYFVFYDYDLDEYGYSSSLFCDFDEMEEYSDKVAGIINDDSGNNRLNKIVDFWKGRFGFMTYPLELFSDLYNRFTNINFGEPIIHIPELHDPFFNNKIFDGIDFNFNSLLENSTFAFIYNFYLTAVDFIIAISLARLGYHYLWHDILGVL